MANRTGTVTGGVLYKKVLLKISQNFTATLSKKETIAHVFSVNFAKLLRAPFLQNTSEQLLLVK